MGDNDSFQDVKNPLVRWAISQGVVSFLLIVIIAGGGYLARWAIADAVPAHLQMIQEGYKKQEESHDKQLERVIQAFEKELDRVSNRPVAHSAP